MKKIRIVSKKRGACGAERPTCGENAAMVPMARQGAGIKTAIDLVARLGCKWRVEWWTGVEHNDARTTESRHKILDSDYLIPDPLLTSHQPAGRGFREYRVALNNKLNETQSDHPMGNCGRSGCRDIPDRH